jgi:hypothetical protein
MTLHKLTEFYIKWSSVCLNVTSKFQTTATFESSIKEHNDSNKTCRYVYDLSLYTTSFV